MLISESLLAELEQEAANTKKVLERVPTDKFDWKPHDKSFSLGRLAGHVAELPSWVGATISHDQLDFAVSKYTPTPVKDTAGLMQSFHDHLAEAVAILKAVKSDDELMKKWTLRNGDHIILSLPKAAVLRAFVLNHIVHHRAQLTVYLRLLDIPVPGIYGPTADES